MASGTSGLSGRLRAALVIHGGWEVISARKKCLLKIVGGMYVTCPCAGISSILLEMTGDFKDPAGNPPSCWKSPRFPAGEWSVELPVVWTRSPHSIDWGGPFDSPPVVKTLEFKTRFSRSACYFANITISTRSALDSSYICMRSTSTYLNSSISCSGSTTIFRASNSKYLALRSPSDTVRFLCQPWSTESISEIT